MRLVVERAEDLNAGPLADDVAAAPRGAARHVNARRFSVTQWFAVIVGALLLVAGRRRWSPALLSLAALTDRRERLADRIDPANLAVLRLSNALRQPGDRDPRLRARAATRRSSIPTATGSRTRREALRGARARSRASSCSTARATTRRGRGELADAWRDEYAEPAIAAVGRRREPRPLRGSARQRFDAVRAQRRRDAARPPGRARPRARRPRRRRRASSTTHVHPAGVLILVALGAAALVLRQVVIAPLRRLAGDVRAVAGGDFERAVEPSGPARGRGARRGRRGDARADRGRGRRAARRRDGARSPRRASCSAPTRSSSSSPTSPRTTCRSRCARSRASPRCSSAATRASSTSAPTATSPSRSTAPSGCRS